MDAANGENYPEAAFLIQTTRVGYETICNLELFHRPGNSFSETLLETEEYNCCRNSTDKYPEHQHSIVCFISSLQVGDQHRHCDRGIILQDDFWPQIVIPCVHKSNCHCSGVG